MRYIFIYCICIYTDTSLSAQSYRSSLGACMYIVYVWCIIKWIYVCMHSSFMVLGACVQKWTSYGSSSLAVLLYLSLEMTRWGHNPAVRMTGPQLWKGVQSSNADSSSPSNSKRQNSGDHVTIITSGYSCKPYVRPDKSPLLPQDIYSSTLNHWEKILHYQWGWKLGSHLCSVQTPQWRQQPEVLQSHRNVWGKEMNPTYIQ